MMRSLKLLFFSLVTANMLALVMFFAWLGASDRLSTGRVERIREMLAETTAEERARLDREAADAALEAEEAERRAREGTMPMTAEDRLRLEREATELMRQEMQRMQRETQDLRRTLLDQQQRLFREREAFTTEREAFESLREEIVAREGDEQFQRALQIYETSKPAEAAERLLALVDTGDAAQVVAYLNAMRPRSATKIVSEMQRRRAPELAADLLEDLRTYGLTAEASEDPD